MLHQRTPIILGIVLAVVIAASVLYAAVGQSSQGSRNQATSPVNELSLHLVGVHIIKDAPDHQYVAHHYCQQINPELIQCAVFDSDQPGAKLMDVEYVLSDVVYDTFSPDEQQYWHPHSYEVDNGLLRAPELSAEKEKEVLDMVKGTHGKTWHLWATKEDPYPLHAPDLAWSITQDGQLREDIGKELESAHR